MEKKGLCISCVNDKDCIFSLKPPVWECEEHSFGQVKVTVARNKCGAVPESESSEE